ncbi:MAG: outer membrane protein assembly factor BamA [Saprospiraceae bacterium]|jgi:outer membrane protein assembly factor BamA
MADNFLPPKLEITGNQKTDTRVIAQEVVKPSGSEYSELDVQNTQDAIMALGLFELVQVALYNNTGEPTLNIVVKEKKHDWYVLPRINRNGDGDVTLGVDWRDNNFKGLNQRVRLTIAQKEYDGASRNKESRINFRYLYPRIVGTDYSASFDTTLVNVGIDEEREGLKGIYERNHVSVGAGVGKWFGKSGTSKGLLVYLGGRYSQYDHELESGDAGLYFDATTISLETNIVYRNVNDNLYSRSGQQFGIRFSMADESFGSDVNLQYQTAYYRRYLPVGSIPHTNFNYQIQLGSGKRSIFGESIYDLSGDYSLRGFARETLEGDAFFVVNTEYLRPLFGKPHVRGALLLDFGNAYSSFADITDADLEVGAGIGLRWQFKSWVNTELRIDAAYGFGDLGGSRVYVSTNAAF